MDMINAPARRKPSIYRMDLVRMTIHKGWSLILEFSDSVFIKPNKSPKNTEEEISSRCTLREKR